MESEFILAIFVLPGFIWTALFRAHRASGAVRATKWET
jgi:hypothetical protein